MKATPVKLWERINEEPEIWALYQIELGIVTQLLATTTRLSLGGLWGWFTPVGLVGTAIDNVVAQREAEKAISLEAAKVNTNVQLQNNKYPTKIEEKWTKTVQNPAYLQK